jgi:hypothetical protein
VLRLAPGCSGGRGRGKRRGRERPPAGAGGQGGGAKKGFGFPIRAIYPFPQFHHLPASLPLDGAVHLEPQNGLPVLRASTAVQRRITALLRK